MEKTMELTISRVTEYDASLLPQLDALLMQLDCDVPRLIEEVFQGVLNNPHTYLLVARNISDNEVVGMLTLVTHHLLEGQKGTIEDVVVDEKMRGQGIGERLTIAAIDTAREVGLSSIGLTSRSSRVAANKLYQKLGFVQRETNVYKYAVE